LCVLFLHDFVQEEAAAVRLGETALSLSVGCIIIHQRRGPKDWVLLPSSHEVEMRLPFKLQKRLLRLIDGFYATWPQPRPVPETIQNCRIVSHRGEHDNRAVLENTLEAFHRAYSGGVWGIEFDVRWTRDLQPVVFHDMDCRRLFGVSVQISQFSLAELKEAFPLIPSLPEVIEVFGKKMHLMVELKQEPYPHPVHQKKVLRDLFCALKPQKDYHFMALELEMFQAVDFVPTSACVPIAELNIQSLSPVVLRGGYGGMAGQYVLFTDRLIRKHKTVGQRIGTGYVGSRNSLYRELNRGVDWVFSNNALEIQSYCRLN
jgi:glycerophosphoryl diester phosphodiesterase